MTTIWAGLAIGALYSLVAIGYNVTLLAAGVFNFAYANLIMIGTFIAYWATVTMGMPVYLAILVSAACVAVIAVAEERVAIRPLQRHPHSHAALITTVGSATVLNGLAAIIWGREPMSVKSGLPSQPLNVLGAPIRLSDLLLIVCVVAVGVGLHVFSRRTLIGLASLATAEDRDAAQARGINVGRIGVLAFALSGAIAGAFAILVAVRTYAVFDLANALSLFGFVAIAIGGAGNMLGGMVGGFATGLILAFSSRYFGASWPQIVVFACFLVLLLVRPRGLFGTALGRQV